MNKKKISIIIGIIIILIDQITKIILANKNIIIIPNILKFSYTENRGVAFGIGTGNIIIIILANIIILGIIIRFLKEKQEQINFKILFVLIMILSGGISNLIDRIFRGYVIDYIDINLFNFPNFNIADISITLGTITLIVIIIKSLFSKDENINIKEEK
jgi:signal peptidase II